MAAKKKKKRRRAPRREKQPRPPESTPTDEVAGDVVAAEEETPAGEPRQAVEKETGVEAEPGSITLEEGEAEEPEAEEVEQKGTLRSGLLRSRKLLARPFNKASVRKAIDPEFWTEAEEALVAADAGVLSSSEIVQSARKTIMSEGIHDLEGLKGAFRREVVEKLESFGAPPEPGPERPRVVFIVGVNGVGKTTTAAKVGFMLEQQGEKVLFAAADTFRAAGIEQMEMWAKRVGAPVVRHKTGGDPAAVVFDSIESATARGLDVVLVDTAGRLHTKKNLMEELSKMWRVAERQLEGNPQAILVIDATTGQNGVNQARIFSEAMEISSIALTKMDGSAKGGVILAIGRELDIPVAYVGVGEGLSDLRPFDPEEYAKALF